MMSLPLKKSTGRALLAMLTYFSVCLLEGRAAEDLEWGAAGWFQYGVIEKSSDSTNGADFNGVPMIGNGAQVSLYKVVSDAFDIRVGLGVAGANPVAASLGSGGYSPQFMIPYVSEARFKYNIIDGEQSALFLEGGVFSFQYAQENKNLGLYLLRGPVYPGIVLSGFETKETIPVANLLGLHLRHEIGGLYQDVIFSSEVERTPFFDISPAYILGYEKEGVFDVSAGANFFHFIPADDSITNDVRWFHVDTTLLPNDTTQISFQGTKLMARASLDFKALFGRPEILGEEDLKIYGEVALLGLENNKAYNDLFGGYGERMPMMAGFNVPVFGFLDHLSFEMELYKAKFPDDLSGFKNTSGNEIKPFPPEKFDWVNRDNFKWSVHGAKVFRKHLKLSFQVANDHFRPGVFAGYGDNNPPDQQAIMIHPSNWYWMTKIAYFF